MDAASALPDAATQTTKFCRIGAMIFDLERGFSGSWPAAARGGRGGYDRLHGKPRGVGITGRGGKGIISAAGFGACSLN